MPAINLGPMTDFAGLRGDAVLAEAAWVLASTAADDIAVLRSRLDRQYSESRYRSVICVTSFVSRRPVNKSGMTSLQIVIPLCLLV
jgi:hypothetical protein